VTVPTNRVYHSCDRLFALGAATFQRTITESYFTNDREEHGSVLDRTGSGLTPILAGSGLDRTAIFLKSGGSGLDRTEKIYVVSM